MRIFLSTLFLLFILHPISKADDIREFEIEGISIGDSLIDHISLNKIEQLKESYYTDNLYTTITVFPGETKIELKNYDALVMSFLSSDNKFKLQGLSGIVIYKKNINDCKKKRNEIVDAINSIFSNIIPQNNDFDAEFGNVKSVEFDFKNKDMAVVACYDYDPHPTHTDHLRVSLNRKKFLNWIENKAYK